MHFSKTSLILLGLASSTVFGLVARDSSKVKYDRYDVPAVEERDSSKVKYDRYDVPAVEERDSSKVKYDRYDAPAVETRDSSKVNSSSLPSSFSATAVAALQDPGTLSSSSPSDESGLLLDSVPSFILSVLETAIPATWWSGITNPTSVSSFISQIEAVTMPAWCNSLPSSVKAWYTSAYSGGFANPFIDALATPLITATTSTTASVTTTTSLAHLTSSASTANSSGITTIGGAISSASASASSDLSNATSTGGVAVSGTTDTTTIDRASPSLRIHLSSHQNLSDNDEILGDIPNTPPEPR
ncbi:GPI anchored hypothetical protein [Penicillium daleae]|uniref:Uncharacterized protein n=1 Tax=Penicillium daleae TaxID=63821 RepID=A0AAD6G0Z7_9EURO|nr:GPI anchored hypothetical protein [Penicillium daleae]KAJ5443713.1 GPI anchored hypothetical protein [Penicillium daleae]